MQVMKFRYYAAAAVTMLCMLAGPAQAMRVGIAAIVGDDVITTSDVDARRNLVMALAGIPDTAENQRKIMPRIMQLLIDETLQLQEAKRSSLVVTDAEIKTAIDAMGRSSATGEDIRTFIAKNGLSMPTLESQVRAQLLWSKVVQRKLRRNVNVSQDEVLRAQQAQASAPGAQELRIGAIDIEIASPEKQVEANKLASEMVLQLKAGTDMASVADSYLRQSEVSYKQPVWVVENRLPPTIQQAVRGLKDGEITAPVQAGNLIQILQVIQRRTAEKNADTTEYAVKQIAVPVPPKPDKTSLAALQKAVTALRTNPGDCMSEKIQKVNVPTDVKFVRTTLAVMSPEQRSILSNLEVGSVSEPLMGPDAVRLVMLCEKIEPATGNLPDANKVRQELFGEKMELEAQKHLRNLRRDAFIDIKGMQ